MYDHKCQRAGCERKATTIAIDLSTFGLIISNTVAVFCDECMEQSKCVGAVQVCKINDVVMRSVSDEPKDTMMDEIATKFGRAIRSERFSAITTDTSHYGKATLEVRDADELTTYEVTITEIN